MFLQNMELNLKLKKIQGILAILPPMAELKVNRDEVSLVQSSLKDSKLANN